MQRRKAATIGALAFALGLLLAACSSSSSDGSKATSTTAASAVTTTTTDGISHGGVTKPPTLEKPKGAFPDLKVKGCAKGPGAVTASGSIKNSTKAAQDFVLSVRWVNPKGNGVIDQDTAVIQGLAAGKSQAWQLSGKVTGKAKSECSFRVQRGTIQ